MSFIYSTYPLPHFRFIGLWSLYSLVYQLDIRRTSTIWAFQSDVGKSVRLYADTSAWNLLRFQSAHCMSQTWLTHTHTGSHFTAQHDAVHASSVRERHHAGVASWWRPVAVNLLGPRTLKVVSMTLNETLKVLKLALSCAWTLTFCSAFPHYFQLMVQQLKADLQIRIPLPQQWFYFVRLSGREFLGWHWTCRQSHCGCNKPVLVELSSRRLKELVGGEEV